ncbi:hypothetical protein F3K40_13605 [Streptomyces sp. LBUM 1478]|uniref:Uncharacterized protein n=1 Tax=Streptomyces scabiei (strain 87.22) TaxID=680198 RepID=C9YTL3_STRSW|nr:MULTISPECIES: hypothetical protein [Streptomyces]MBP5863023.1 hypothetical protein [Streptomyces sp. LBUM 1484]MBP5906547.1 hypothetical protein [Streptomyces sp. LBUM 1478]MBP5930762.1 hypothetical protein [Streptomyces sp. LBUM 1479]MBP5876506.1 hypothetical protein [Streptomyces sp. LBUM 1477]MBP5884262.1 hypothetical protein [Streptomyces sp. LBUM 1487]
MREPGAEADAGAFQRSEGEVRLLPWTGIEGKPCCLVGDGRGGPISRLADATESIQLGMASELLAHARDMLPNALPGELAFLSARLTEALADALRVAESRGHRLGP